MNIFCVQLDIALALEAAERDCPLGVQGIRHQMTNDFGLTQSDIAEILDLSPSTWRNHRNQAYAILCELLGDYCGKSPGDASQSNFHPLSDEEES